MPTQKKAKKISSKTKTNKNALPERNIAAEVFIQVGAFAILAYAVMLAIYAFFATIFKATSNVVLGPIALIVFLLCVNFIVQGLKLTRETNRVDNYTQRIVAICLILLLPIVLIVFQSGAIYPRGLADSMIMSHIFNGTLIVSGVLSIIGSIWLWVLFAYKDKLVWIVKPTSGAKPRELKQTVQGMAKKKKLGFIFLFGPVALFALLSFLSIIGNGSLPLLFVLIPIQQLLSYLWLPSVIVGVIILVKRK